jgi:Tfp pilus assembly ATPase PilU
MDLFATVPTSDFLRQLEPARSESAERPLRESLHSGFMKNRSADFVIRIADNGDTQWFRLNAVQSNNGREVAIIARSIEDQESPALSDFKCPRLVRAWALERARSKASAAARGDKKPSRYFAIPPRLLFNDERLRSGLYIVFGSTESGKSFLADAIARYGFHKEDFKGHIVRYGDPVEGSLLPCVGDCLDLFSLDTHFFETTRNHPIDTPDLRQFGTDMLRQKPKIITVSELREDSELVSAIEMASTGHTVIATAHAGSLDDGFLRLMRATGCFEHPDLKVPLVNSLQAVLHLSRQSPKPKHARISTPCKVSLPTVWYKTEQSKQRFETSGIDCLHPSSSADAYCRSAISYYRDPEHQRICAAIATVDEMLELGEVHHRPTTKEATSFADIPAAVSTCMKPWRDGISKIEDPNIGEAVHLAMCDHLHAKMTVKRTPGKLTISLPAPDARRFRKLFANAFEELILSLREVNWS